MLASPSQTQWRDRALAIVLALVMTLAWTVRDWGGLTQLRLPDTDDAMRLQQIRDWLGGQAFADLAQHRLGAAPGLEMHWSRLPDLVPAALTAMLTPTLGAHAAELAAVIIWPALLLIAALALTGGIARRLGAAAPTAIVIAALAYPATTLFLPGRIDHHGLQLVLVLLLARSLIGAGTLAGGVIAGLATAASLAIGLETAPLLAVGGAAIVAHWIALRPGAQPRLLGFGVSLVLALAGAAGLLRTSGWDWPACDGFTAELWRAAQIAALAPLMLALLGFRIETVRARAIAAVAIGGAAGGAALWLSPACLHPYGQVDPLLARLWLGHVAEAQPLLAAPTPLAIGYAGLMLSGLAAGVWIVWRSRSPDWLTVLAFQIVAALVTLVQLRGAYAGAMLAAPALAMVVAAARAKRVLALGLAWIGSAGIAYPLLGDALVPAPAGVASEQCITPGAVQRLAALPPGTLLAPLDLGAYAIAATRHRVIAAPYHRNNAGNRAFYDFVGGDTAVLAKWRVDYVAFCPSELRGPLPIGLTLLSPPGEGLQLYRVVR